MIVDIRGGLGTQVLELLGCYALAIERGQAIAGIRVNTGSVVHEGLHNYVSDIFDALPPVTVTLGAAKLGVFRDRSILRLAMKHHARIIASLGMVRHPPIVPELPVMHVRTGSRMMVPMQAYIDYTKARDVLTIGNNPDDLAMVPARNISTTPVNDWLTAFHARELIGTASTFVMAMLFINPKKRVSMWANQEGEAFTQVCGPIMREFENQFPNFQWLR